MAEDNNDTLIDYRGVEVCRSEKSVLKDVTFKVKKGEFCYLVGKVGSGKSSLMKTMYADVPLSKGEKAKVMGYEMKGIKRKTVPFLRRKVGIVFQDFQLLEDRSVYSNLRFVLHATGWKSKLEMEQRMNEVLEAVGMANKGYKMPHELSGGEQQRIVIARALLNRPELILADEPTGNLDPDTGILIAQLLHNLTSSGTAVVMATHNLSLPAQFPGRILICEDKHLREKNRTLRS